MAGTKATQEIEKFKRVIELNYLDALLENVRKGLQFLEVDYSLVSGADPELAQLLLDEPDDYLRYFEIACEYLCEDIQDGPASIRVRLFNLPESQKVVIRDIRKAHIGRLICVEGVVRARTDVRPKAKSSRFECTSCGEILNVLHADEKLKEPSICGCGKKRGFRLIENVLIDSQRVVLEEDLSVIGDDTLPKKLKVLLQDDLTAPAKNEELLPGRAARFVGVLKEFSVHLRNGVKSVDFDLYLDCVNFELIEDELKRIHFTKKDIESFRELASRPNLLDLLRASVAPTIFGHDIIKEAALLFLVKGVRKESADGSVSARDSFHVLLIGDPGSGKTVIGKEVNSLSYKCKRAVGKGASGVGLTASAEKNDLLGERALSAGTIPLCNDGHVVIDEVDKMDDEVQSHLLDCMEDGIISVNKSQVQGVLKANVGIFMVANPKYGRFDPNGVLFEQVKFSAPLITRFDSMFPVLDVPDAGRDEALVDTILSKHFDIDKASERPIEFGLLRKYLFYVSRNIRPKLSREALRVIKDFCLDLRAQGGSVGKEKTVSITGRQIDGPVRLAEAYAKLRMSAVVSAADAHNAVDMMQYSLRSFGFDKETGKIDIDRISSGVSGSLRSAIRTMKEVLEEMVWGPENKVPIENIVERAKMRGVSRERADEALEKLKRDGDVAEVRKGFLSKI